MPKDREGTFHIQVFQRYHRSEPEVAESLTEMFVNGTSTHKVGKVVEKLMGVAPLPAQTVASTRTSLSNLTVWRGKNGIVNVSKIVGVKQEKQTSK